MQFTSSLPILLSYPVITSELKSPLDSPINMSLESGHDRPRQGTEICNLRGAFSTGFFDFSPVDFFLLRQVYCVI